MLNLHNAPTDIPVAVGTKWTQQPTDPGFYVFRGIRYSRRGSIVRVNELMHVDWTFVALEPSLAAVYFGRSTKYRITDFEGWWLHLDVDVYGGKGRDHA